MCNENDGVALYSTSHPVGPWRPMWWLRLRFWWRMQCAWNPWKKWRYVELTEIKPGRAFTVFDVNKETKP